MGTESEGSVTGWIGELKSGEPDAAGQLWKRYFNGLVRLARSKLEAVPRAATVEDEEDAALDAFQSLCAGAAAGRFDRLKDRDDLWRLLVVITMRKVCDQIRRQHKLKRGGGRVVPEAALAGLDPDGPGSFEQFIGREPDPEFAAMLAEEFQARLGSLSDPGLRQVALWKLEGYSSDEIANRLGCVGRTVDRKLDLIRKFWRHVEP
jgi:DNA-directed RNA polymerase specialized sigma24 family protein